MRRLNEVVNADDVRMRQFEAAARLGFQPLDFVMIRDEMGREKFQRDGLFQHAIMRQPHHAHAAFPQRAGEVIATKHALASGERVFGFSQPGHR